MLNPGHLSASYQSLTTMFVPVPALLVCSRTFKIAQMKKVLRFLNPSFFLSFLWHPALQTSLLFSEDYGLLTFLKKSLALDEVGFSNYSKQLCK